MRSNLPLAARTVKERRDRAGGGFVKKVVEAKERVFKLVGLGRRVAVAEEGWEGE